MPNRCSKRPDRFQGLAALAMQDPDGAARELERCVKELGFRGALVNGFSQVGDAETVVYYDLPQYRPFWAMVERLDVPFYLHPRNPLPRDAKIYEGHPWLMGPVWAFGHETAVHALRLMGSGLFDAHPRLNIILGHMGENLPFALWRVDNANAWIANRHNYPAKKQMREYFSANFYVTTSGNFHTPALLNAMSESAASASCSRPTGRSKISITPQSGSMRVRSVRTIGSRSAAPTPGACSSWGMTEAR